MKTPEKILAPPIQKEAGWEELHLPFNIGSGRTLYAGLEQDGRLVLRFFKRQSDAHLIGKAWFGPGTDGPPEHAHGGVIAYVLDEAMGAAAWMNLYPVVAAKLDFQYHQMSPLEKLLTVEAWIDAPIKNRLTIHAHLLLPSGAVSVSASGQFAILSQAKVAPLIKAGNQPFELFKSMKWAEDNAD